MGRARGAALLTALLIVSVAVAVTAAMLSAQHLEIRKSATILNRDRAMQFALGGEAWAMGILTRDATEGNIDHLNEIWAATPPPMPITGGSATGRIHDLQGRFNLNNLLVDGKQSPVDRLRFERLLGVVGLNRGLAVAVIDWIDADDVVAGPGGAEDVSYTSKNPPYRAANQKMVSPSELRLIEGFSGEGLERLLPLVTALPERTELNINTAPVEILMTLVENMSQTDAAILEEKRRSDKGLSDLAPLLANPVLQGKDVLSAGFGVGSRYFLAEGEVRLGRARTRLTSLLHRKDGKVSVLRRVQGGEY
ncbi:MAG: type II secretion system minor pseudopilin GspK [Magnetococcales bacterium]|nr:type II secretion system minor pseudopilin GspK [Magnetococcales bacterium]